MKLDILHALNAERAARRAVVLVTDVASGAQRLVKAADAAKDPLRETIEKRLRMGKSGMEETPQGRVFLTVHVPSPQLVITGAVHISQTLAPLGQLLGYDVTIVDPRTAFASIERFPDVKVIARMAGRGAAAAQCRPLHRLRRAHARSQDRRPGAHARARARLLLYRRAWLAEDPCQAHRAAERAGHHRRRLARIHAPIGLAIGAVSPAEIAVAIMGEITASALRRRQSRRRRRAAGNARDGGMKFGAVPLPRRRSAPPRCIPSARAISCSRRAP